MPIKRNLSEETVSSKRIRNQDLTESEGDGGAVEESSTTADQSPPLTLNQLNRIVAKWSAYILRLKAKDPENLCLWRIIFNALDQTLSLANLNNLSDHCGVLGALHAHVARKVSRLTEWEELKNEVQEMWKDERSKPSNPLFTNSSDSTMTVQEFYHFNELNDPHLSSVPESVQKVTVTEPTRADPPGTFTLRFRAVDGKTTLFRLTVNGTIEFQDVRTLFRMENVVQYDFSLKIGERYLGDYESKTLHELGIIEDTVVEVWPRLCGGGQIKKYKPIVGGRGLPQEDFFTLFKTGFCLINLLFTVLHYKEGRELSSTSNLRCNVFYNCITILIAFDDATITTDRDKKILKKLFKDLGKEEDEAITNVEAAALIMHLTNCCDKMHEPEAGITYDPEYKYKQSVKVLTEMLAHLKTIRRQVDEAKKNKVRGLYRIQNNAFKEAFDTYSPTAAIFGFRAVRGLVFEAWTTLFKFQNI